MMMYLRCISHFLTIMMSHLLCIMPSKKETQALSVMKENASTGDSYKSENPFQSSARSRLYREISAVIVLSLLPASRLRSWCHVFNLGKQLKQIYIQGRQVHSKKQLIPFADQLSANFWNIFLETSGIYTDAGDSLNIYFFELVRVLSISG